MKSKTLLLTLSILVPSLVGCTASKKQPQTHVHTFSDEWTYNENQHWHAATCGHTEYASEVGNHIDDNKDLLCDVCGYQLGEIIKSISLNGSLTKTSYEYSDDWDLSGLYVKATYNSGRTAKLKDSEYTLTTNAAKPKNFTFQLVVTATLKSDTSIRTNKTFKAIQVADEVFDEAKEIKDYYEDCNLTYSSSTLMNELHRHSFSKHSYFVQYGETQQYLSKSKDFEAPDLIPGEHKTEHFYTGNKTTYSSGSREHIWACADSSGLWTHGKVDADDYIGGGSDLYHIRPCNTQVNTARGDAPYVDFDDSEFSSYKSSVVEVGDAGPYKLKIYGANEVREGVYEFASLAEPADEFKGDIARIVAYLYMHYNTNTKTPSSKKYMTGDLVLNKVIGYNTVSKAKTVLKQWNELDPVSEVEKRRNHTVQQIQGNRNPFVDYPELIDRVF